MNLGFSLLAVAILVLIAVLGVGLAGLYTIFGVVIPYAAFAIFLVGAVYRVLEWAGTPVPFRIPTTCGQQKSLPWIKADPLESPHNTAGVVGRMALEVLLFRSLFRNTKMELRGERPLYGGAKWLWLAGLVFHWSFLFIVLRHLRFFFEPVPWPVNMLAGLDGLFEIGVPTLYLTDVAILLGGFLPLLATGGHPAVALHLPSVGLLSPLFDSGRGSVRHSYCATFTRWISWQ